METPSPTPHVEFSLPLTREDAARILALGPEAAIFVVLELSARLVEPRVVDAMPRATFGHRLVALTAWLHYGVGIPISQVLEVLNRHLHFPATEGGLVHAWQRLAAVLLAWYTEIGEQVRASGVLHADETGWHVSGRTHWLWCFTTRRATYYMIHRNRGSPALSKFFTAGTTSAA